MKNLKLLIMFLAVVGMVSCSDDDERGQATSKNIEGTWELTDYSLNGSTIEQFNGQTITTNYSAVATEIDNVLVTFNQDGTISTNGNTFTLKFTIESNGESITQEFQTNALPDSGTYEKDGNVLTITNEGESVDVDILVLSNTVLHLNGVLPSS